MTTDAEESAELLQHRLLLFTGKGGVGKTTVVAAMAVHAASLGMRPLVIELGHRESMRAVFGVHDIGFAPRDVGLGVHAMSVDVDLALVDYFVQQLPSRRVAKGIASNKVLERLFKAMPAVGEIATLNKLRQLERETLSDGSPRWGPILIDLDATGHAIMFLELRNTLEGLVGGPMRKLIESTADLLADPQRCRLSLVTTPEDLPVTETIELHQRLHSKQTVAFGRVFANRVPSTILDASTRPDLDALMVAGKAVGDAEVVADVQFAHQVLDQQDRARAQIRRLREEVDLPVVELPKLVADRFGPEELAKLGALALGSGRGERG